MFPRDPDRALVFRIDVDLFSLLDALHVGFKERQLSAALGSKLEDPLRLVNF